MATQEEVAKIHGSCHQARGFEILRHSLFRGPSRPVDADVYAWELRNVERQLRIDGGHQAASWGRQLRLIPVMHVNAEVDRGARTVPEPSLLTGVEGRLRGKAGAVGAEK